MGDRLDKAQRTRDMAEQRVNDLTSRRAATAANPTTTTRPTTAGSTIGGAPPPIPRRNPTATAPGLFSILSLLAGLGTDSSTSSSSPSTASRPAPAPAPTPVRPGGSQGQNQQQQRAVPPPPTQRPASNPQPQPTQPLAALPGLMGLWGENFTNPGTLFFHSFLSFSLFCFVFLLNFGFSPSSVLGTVSSPEERRERVAAQQNKASSLLQQAGGKPQGADPELGTPTSLSGWADIAIEAALLPKPGMASPQTMTSFPRKLAANPQLLASREQDVRFSTALLARVFSPTSFFSLFMRGKKKWSWIDD